MGGADAAVVTLSGADSWWVWMVLGFVLAIAEVLVPAFLFLGFALGALATGGVIWFNLVPAAGLAATLVIFASLSLVAWLMWRALPMTRGPLRCAGTMGQWARAAHMAARRSADSELSRMAHGAAARQLSSRPPPRRSLVELCTRRLCAHTCVRAAAATKPPVVERTCVGSLP